MSSLNTLSFNLHVLYKISSFKQIIVEKKLLLFLVRQELKAMVMSCKGNRRKVNRTKLPWQLLTTLRRERSLQVLHLMPTLVRHLVTIMIVWSPEFNPFLTSLIKLVLCIKQRIQKTYLSFE